MITREQKLEIITHALKHLGIGHAVSFKPGQPDAEITLSAGPGRIAFRPDGSLRQAILDKWAEERQS